MNNNIYLYILSIFIFSSSLTFSQNLYVQNPSFEGPSGPGIVPAPWTPCMPGQSPDTQPAWWGVNLAPSDGTTYLGLVHDVLGNWQEGASQQLINEISGLPEPMQAGENYEFSIDLSGDQADMFNRSEERRVGKECER